MGKDKGTLRLKVIIALLFISLKQRRCCRYTTQSILVPECLRV